MTDIKQNTYSAFQKTTVAQLNLLRSLSEIQINVPPKEGWSAGEHALKSYASVNTMNRKTKQAIYQKLEPINTLFSDASIKMNSPIREYHFKQVKAKR